MGVADPISCIAQTHACPDGKTVNGTGDDTNACDFICPTAEEVTPSPWYVPVGVTQWCVACVLVVPAVLYSGHWLVTRFFCSEQEAEIKPEPVVVEEPVVEEPAAPKPAAPVAPVATPVKTPEKPVVTPKSYFNMIIIALIVACVIGMLISVYFVCIK